MTQQLTSLTSQQTLDQFYLEARARILEVAATLDRIDRGSSAPVDDPRLGLLRQAIHVLNQSTARSTTDRAEQLQLLFSRRYDAQWLSEFEPTR